MIGRRDLLTQLAAGTALPPRMSRKILIFLCCWRFARGEHNRFIIMNADTATLKLHQFGEGFDSEDGRFISNVQGAARARDSQDDGSFIMGANGRLLSPSLTNVDNTHPGYFFRLYKDEVKSDFFVHGGGGLNIIILQSTQ